MDSFNNPYHRRVGVQGKDAWRYKLNKSVARAETVGLMKPSSSCAIK